MPTRGAACDENSDKEKRNNQRAFLFGKHLLILSKFLELDLNSFHIVTYKML
jgi:hypothetical protein